MSARKDNDEKLSVLIVAEVFGLEFTPLNCALLKVGSQMLLDVMLNWVMRIDAKEVIVLTTTFDAKLVEEFERKWSPFLANLRFVACQNCATVGDLMREVDSRSLIPSSPDGKNNFLLVDNPLTFCSSNLEGQIAAFKKRRSENKNNVLTLLYSQSAPGDGSVIGFESDSGKVVAYHTHDEPTHGTFSKGMFLSNTTFRTDISSCGIALCAQDVITQFTGNFDFQTLQDLIHEIMVNEEILCQNIHMDVLPEKAAAFRAYDYDTLVNAHSLLLRRWFFPLALERLVSPQVSERPLRLCRDNVYVPMGRHVPQKAKNSVFAEGAQVHQSAVVDGASFGANAVVGEGSIIRNCVVGAGLKSGACDLLEGSIIGDNVVFGDKVHVKPRCIVGPNVKIPAGTVVESGSVLSSAPPPDDEDAIVHQKVHGYYVWKLSTEEDGRFWRDLDRRRSRSSIRSRTQSGNSRGHPSSGGPSAAAAAAAESGEKLDAVLGTTQVGVEIFHAEVLDSMTQTLRSESYASAEQQKNLILEINSSKLAYNIAMDDVTKHLFLAFLALPEASESFAGLKKLFTEWKVLWTNYYRPKSSQVQMLHALEEHALANEKFLPWLPKVIFLAYNDEELVEEESVLEWYDSLPPESPLRTRADLTKLVDWIRASDDSDEEESN